MNENKNQPNSAFAIKFYYKQTPLMSYLTVSQNSFFSHFCYKEGGVILSWTSSDLVNGCGDSSNRYGQSLEPLGHQTRGANFPWNSIITVMYTIAQTSILL